MEARPEEGAPEEEVPHHVGEGGEASCEGLGIVGEGFKEALLVGLTVDAEDEGLEGGCYYSINTSYKFS